MRTIKAYKAQPTIKEEPVEDVTLELHKEFPESESIEECDMRHKENAAWVFRALSVLPQGTRHALLILMLQEKRNLLIVR